MTQNFQPIQRNQAHVKMQIYFNFKNYKIDENNKVTYPTFMVKKTQ